MYIYILYIYTSLFQLIRHFTDGIIHGHAEYGYSNYCMFWSKGSTPLAKLHVHDLWKLHKTCQKFLWDCSFSKFFFHWLHFCLQLCYPFLERSFTQVVTMAFLLAWLSSHDSAVLCWRRARFTRAATQWPNACEMTCMWALFTVCVCVCLLVATEILTLPKSSL